MTPETKQALIDSGEFKAVNPLDTAIAISAIIEGTVMLWLYDPDHIDIKTHIKSNIHETQK